MSDITSIVTTLPVIGQIVSWIKKLIFRNPKYWKGVKLGKRYFAWKGPTLDLLRKRQPIRVPQKLLEELRSAGMKPFYGRKSAINKRLAREEFPVFETDRMNWRRELLLPEYGDQILFVKKV